MSRKPRPDTSHVIIRSARPADEPELRRLLRQVASGGDISLRIEKEPDYFSASAVEGREHDVLVGEDPRGGRLIGFGAMSEKPCFVNRGTETQSLGYLSNLRIESGYRSGDLLFRGYAQFARMHAQRRSTLYLTTIMEGNLVARRALASGRTGLPSYRDVGRLTTYVFGTWKNLFSGPADPAVSVQQATPADLPRLLDFWEREGRTMQFFPACTKEDVTDRTGLLNGLDVNDVYVATSDGSVVGTTAVWDQRPFRQWVIDSYSPRAALARPAYNAWARLTGRPTLPPAGAGLNYRFLALTCIENRSPDIFRQLLSAIWTDTIQSDRGALIMAALHEKDPLSTTLATRPHVPFTSRLYVVHWDDGAKAFASLDGTLTPYIELGSL